jgi:hypothetical protein
MSLMSSNTFGGKLFSDGKMIAMMSPDIPIINKCSRCTTIFWLNQANQVEVPAATAIESVGHLIIADYFTALADKIYQSQDQEIFLRKRIWWGFNDRVRAGQSQFNSEKEKAEWQANNHRLLELLDPNDMYHMLMMAELHRNLGNFREAEKILLSINDPELDGFKNMLKNEIAAKNTEVVLLE